MDQNSMIVIERHHHQIQIAVKLSVICQCADRNQIYRKPPMTIQFMLATTQWGSFMLGKRSEMIWDDDIMSYLFYRVFIPGTGKNNCTKKQRKKNGKKNYMFFSKWISRTGKFWLTQFLLFSFLPCRLRWVTNAVPPNMLLGCGPGNCKTLLDSTKGGFFLSNKSLCPGGLVLLWQQQQQKKTTTTTTQTINNTNNQQPTATARQLCLLCFSISRSLFLVLRFLSFTNSAKIVILFSTVCVIELPHWRRVNLQIGNGSMRPTPNFAGFSLKIQIAKWQQEIRCSVMCSLLCEMAIHV